ncbi:Rgp1-domain-containing protein [Microdochium bolleyi]|uniref:Rgp1-domain-containing protein n=1 Tax=Microdochium bolleyi TaxID=196109 RepID=A0A136JHG0_9PEZI|nr:Rgp1-domain-containing protein [Microdochium bolleyi]
MPDWKFPTSVSPSSEAGETVTNGDYLSAMGVPSPLGPGQRAHLPMRSKDTIPVINEHHTSPAAARILSEASFGTGTPRSSGEFYSMSNNSSETLASEYVAHPAQSVRRPPHLRNLSIVTQSKAPEMLMMGYAQIQGSFTLDGSLVSLAPFEAVKRKAVLGGQGGGVIGLESNKRSSLLQGFGWSSFGSSLGELLGSGEQSSIKDMRGAASSKSIPLLSTPQSVLFVDLQLAPGESKTYEYTFKLPKGLPPTHRGKAIKIVYNLVVGTQRPGSAKGQQVRTVEIPFRVLGSVNSFGEILGHDLLSPYIILRDQAKVNTLDKTTERTPFHKKTKSTVHTSSINEFLHYVDELLEHPRNGGGLLSPTATAPGSRRPSVFGEEVNTAKDAIDLAIMRSNLSDQGQSSNRFEIARNGQRIGVIMLARPAYRLGEVVSMAIDFTGAQVPCYAVHAALETTERVDQSLALRSEASIHRVTRKVFGSSSESTLYARRIVFSPTIPINATPEFVTTGINLEWKIRVEFVVPSSSPSNKSSGDATPATPHHLLEEIARDERGGLVLVAVENLECESFEVAVPLRVYGAVCNGLERLERDEALDEGLTV